MDWSSPIVHWLHLMAAMLWVGGTLATSLMLHPALKMALAEGDRLKVYGALGARLSRLQWATWGILLSTGVWKLWQVRTTPEVFFGPFGHILAVKLILVAAMVALSLAHAAVWGPALVSRELGATERAALARRAALWGRVNGLLMIAIVFCGVLLRYNPW